MDHAYQLIFIGYALSSVNHSAYLFLAHNDSM